MDFVIRAYVSEDLPDAHFAWQVFNSSESHYRYRLLFRRITILPDTTLILRREYTDALLMMGLYTVHKRLSLFSSNKIRIVPFGVLALHFSDVIDRTR